ncbi:hypothetical protein BS50DRAFT_652318 [Corynespora cassiicola Philippines]|uniref:Uncharacterized protein n=1 Tax=Corynespora cassiicola Philippines TaxID=1448308 RepID=A0A2T2N781_CORCC|nr:hypothetical protein BS50DRAFT_652318 [Corynespora cassiicola Philippines]
MRRVEKFDAYHHKPASRFAWAVSEFGIPSSNVHTGKSGYLQQSLEEHSKVRLDEGPGTILLHQLAGLFAFVNLMFGTYIFSSLTFIMFYDTCIVVARYMASAIVYRLILIWEPEGMRTAQEDKLRATRSQGNSQEDDIE